MHSLYGLNIFLPIMALIMALLLAIRVWQHRSMRLSVSFLVLMLALVWWSLSAYMENVSLLLSTKVFWIEMAYPGIVVIPIAWLIFTLQYTHNERWLTRRNLILAAILPVITLVMVFTNSMHHLMWPDIWLDYSFSPALDAVTHGAWYWVNGTYSYCLILLGTIVLIDFFRRSSGIHRRQAGAMLAGSLVPWVGNILFMAGIGPFSVLDPTPLTFAITGIVFYWGLSRLQLLGIIPIAHDVVFKSMGDGVVVLDNRLRVTELNPAAEGIFERKSADIIGRPFNLVLPGQAALLEIKPDIAKQQAIIALGEGQTLRYYSIYVSTIASRQQTSGYVILLHDDTERRKAEGEAREKAVLEAELIERKRAQAELEKSETKYSTLVESSNDGIIILQDAAVKFSSTHMDKMTGFSHVDYLGKPFINFVSPGYRELVIERYKKRLAGETVPGRYEIELIKKDNKSLPVEISASAIEYEGKPADMAVIRDISERKQAEEELKFRAQLLNAATDSIVVTNSKGNIFYFNEAAHRSLGYTREEMAGKKITDFVSPEALKLISSQIDKMLYENGEAIFESVNICKDNSTKPVEVHSRIFKLGGQEYIVSVNRDISERKQAEEAIRISGENFRRSMEESPLGIGIISAEGETLYANRTVLDMWGYSTVEELEATPHRERYTPEAYLAFQERVAKRQKGEFIPANYEVSIKRKNGEVRQLSVSRKDVIWNGSRQFQVIYQDITERKRAEEALRISEENFRSSMDDSPLGIRILTADNDNLYTNRAMLDIWGYNSIEELEATPLQERFTPEEHLVHKERVAKRQRGEFIPANYEVSIKHKNGEVRHLSVSRKDVIWNGGRQLQLIYQDITERTKIEEALRENEQRLREAQSLGKIANYEVDHITQKAIWSDEMYKLFERDKNLPPPTVEEMPGYFSPEEYAKFRELRLIAVNEGKEAHQDITARLPSGKTPVFHVLTRPVKDDKGHLVKLFGVIQDITERKQAEEALRENDRRLKEAQSLGRIGNYEVNYVTSDIMWSDEMYELFERDKNLPPPTSKELANYFSQEEFAKFAELRDIATKKGKESQRDIIIKLPSGKTPIFHISLRPVKNDNGQIVKMFGTFQDITERKQAEEALRESERNLKEAQSLGKIGSGEYDLITGETIWSDEMYVLFERDRTLGPPGNEGITNTEEDKAFNKALRLATEQGQEIHTDLTAHLPSGKNSFISLSLYPVKDEKGKVVKLFSAAQDITERKKVEEGLRVSEAKFRNLVANAATGILISLPDGSILSANKAAVDFFGFDSEAELTNTLFTERYGDAEDRKRLFECLKENGVAKGFEVRLKRRDGTLFWTSANIFSQVTEYGETQYVSIFEDITERKQATEELARLNKELGLFNSKLEAMVAERTRQLEEAVNIAKASNQAKSDFLASMSHELRTPLNAIIGFSQVLGEKYFGSLNDKQSEYVSDIVDSGKHLLSLINDILDLSKIEAGKMELELSNVKVKDLLQNSLVMVKEKALTHNLSLEMNIAKNIESLEIMADERHLKQVMFNLLSNATKFTPDGGVIKVEAGKVKKELVVSVSDNGIGITAEEQKRIFEVFYQASSGLKDKTPGTGLGLSITRGIVEKHGGRIWFESEGRNKGTRFTFAIPIVIK